MSFGSSKYIVRFAALYLPPLMAYGQCRSSVIDRREPNFIYETTADPLVVTHEVRYDLKDHGSEHGLCERRLPPPPIRRHSSGLMTNLRTR